MSELTIGQAAKSAGVPLEVLRELCEARKVQARKGERGHWYLSPETTPTRNWVLEAVRQQYRDDVAGAQKAMTRRTREVEAVQLDLNEAAEDATGGGRLGNDLRSFAAIDSTFERARHSLMRRLLDVQLSHRRLQALAEHPAHDGPG